MASVIADSRRRVVLPLPPGSTVQFELLSTGQILLTPVEVVPKHKLETGRLEDGSKVRFFSEEL
jgi:hypothetical protein